MGDQRDYGERSSGAINVGLGECPRIVVVDFQKGFAEEQYPLGGGWMGGAASAHHEVHRYRRMSLE